MCRIDGISSRPMKMAKFREPPPLTADKNVSSQWRSSGSLHHWSRDQYSSTLQPIQGKCESNNSFVYPTKCKMEWCHINKLLPTCFSLLGFIRGCCNDMSFNIKSLPAMLLILSLQNTKHFKSIRLLLHISKQNTKWNAVIINWIIEKSNWYQ